MTNMHMDVWGAALNLQLFATQTTTLNAEGNDLSPEMKTFYEKRLLDNAEPNLVHDQFGDKYPIPAGGGKTIEFRKYSPLDKATTPITEGVTPDGNKLNVTASTATIAQYGDWIQLSDLLDLTAIDNNVLQATKLLGAQSGRTLDTVTREALAGGTNVIYAPKVGADGTKTPVTSRSALDATAKIDVDLIFRAARALKTMNADKIDDSYVAIVHPDVSYDLMRSEEWIDAHKYATPDNIYQGEIGKLGGVRFVESTEAKIWCGGNLAGNSRTLTVNNASGYSGATSVVFDGGTVAEDALIGRYVIINGTRAKVTDNTTTTLTLDTAVTCDDNAVIYPGEGGAEGLAVYATLVLGAHAYGLTEVTGGGLQHIVKQLGYGDDPLNQRSSCGWKATKAVKRLVEEYMVRIESCSTFSATAAAN